MRRGAVTERMRGGLRFRIPPSLRPVPRSGAWRSRASGEECPGTYGGRGAAALLLLTSTTRELTPMTTPPYTAENWPIAAAMLPFGSTDSRGGPIHDAEPEEWAKHLRL